MTKKSFFSFAGPALLVLAVGLVSGCGRDHSLDHFPAVASYYLVHLDDGSFLPFKNVYKNQRVEQQAPDGTMVAMDTERDVAERSMIVKTKPGNSLTLYGEWRKVDRYPGSIDVFVFWGSGEPYNELAKRMNAVREYVKKHPEMLKED